MAKGRIEQEIVVKVVGGKDVADLEQQIKDLIKQKAKVVVDVDADADAAKKKLDAIDQQVTDLEKLKAEIEVTADTDDADKKIDDIDKQLADLKGQKAELEVKVKADTDEADRKLAELDTQLADLRGAKAELVVEAQVSQALAALDDVAAEARDAKAAADALGTALGPELTAKADIDSIVSDLRNTGLTFKDVADHAERFGDKLRDIATADPGGSLNDSFRRVRGSIDGIAQSASSSKSVLANMIGNTSQDLGALAGLAGGAGVAIGQMGEYMADAAFNGDKFSQVIRNFAAVAGPAAALAVVISTVTGFMNKQKAAAEESAQRTEDFGEAMRDAADDAVGLADSLRDNLDPLREINAGAEILGSTWAQTVNDLGRSVPLIGRLYQDTSIDVVDAMDAAGISIFQFGKAIEGSEADRAAFLQLLEDFKDAGLITSRQYDGLVTATNNYATEVDKARQAQHLMNIDLDEAQGLLAEMKIDEDPFSQFQDRWKSLVDDLRDGKLDAKDAADTINFLAEKLGKDPGEILALALERVADEEEAAGDAAEEAAEKQEKLEEATREVAEAAEEAAAEWKAMADEISEKSFQEAIDQFNSLSELDLAQMRQNTVKSFDDVKAAIKTAAEEVEGWGRMDLTPDSFAELRGMPDQFAAITDAISGMRGSIQTELKAAFDTGGIQEFSTKFDFFAGQVREQFTTMFRGLGLPEDQVQAQVDAILADLSLLPKQKEIIIRLTLAQEGRNALDLFMDEITGLEALNPEVDIKARIAQGDIAGALAELNALRIAAGRDPIVLPTEVSRVGLERATADAVTAANNYARNHPAVIPSKVGTPTGAAAAYRSAQNTLKSYGPLIIGARVVAGAQVRYDAGGTVTGDGGIAGERGPEILDGKYLTAGPTYVPPGTRVTSRRRTQVILNRNGGDGLRRYDNGGTVVAGPRTINVNVNAAVVGNRFDVARAVSRANGDIARLMGTRG